MAFARTRVRARKASRTGTQPSRARAVGLGGAIVLVALLALAACSSGNSNSNTTASPSEPAQWNPGAASELRALAGRLRTAIPGECADFGLPKPKAWLSSAAAIKTATPTAVGTCTALDEDLELVTFKTVADRDSYVATRSRVLCERAKSGHIALPGLRWVVGANWSIQPDSEGVGRRVANAVGAKYRLDSCGGKPADWTPAAEARAQALVKRLTDAQVGCTDFTYEDRDVISSAPQFYAGVPAALGRCTIGTDSNVDVSVFDSTSVSRDKWIPTYLAATYCPSAPQSTAVVGDDYAVFTTQPAVATKVRDALGASPTGRTCTPAK